LNRPLRSEPVRRDEVRDYREFSDSEWLVTMPPGTYLAFVGAETDHVDRKLVSEEPSAAVLALGGAATRYPCQAATVTGEPKPREQGAALIRPVDDAE
jgi:hypothetical protein